MCIEKKNRNLVLNGSKLEIPSMKCRCGGNCKKRNLNSERKNIEKELHEKYNSPVPRYTSFPTVPYWQTEKPSTNQWENSLLSALKKEKEISLYIHLPFCEKLCTYCGCNKRITKNHNVEEPYIDAVLLEWERYCELFSERPVIQEIHLGGGTPTFFSPASLSKLIQGILAKADRSPKYSFGLEVHPGTTSFEQLKTLADLGFNRISIGVQDFDLNILKAINRIQTYQQIEEVTSWARSLGYDSVNFDLIFGLPFQTIANIEDTCAKVSLLKPDRIAFYSYAHVPWIKPSQRAYSEKDLPQGAEKRALYLRGKELLEKIGYQEIGLDHFALPTDALTIAKTQRTLHRNFMGYTPFHSLVSIGLGVSAISDCWNMYIQNEKNVEDYLKRIHENDIPFFRGHTLSEKDLLARRKILNIMCHQEITWNEEDRPKIMDLKLRLSELIKDGLVQLNEEGMVIPDKGKPFIRNIALAFDHHYWDKQPKEKVFSTL